MLQAPALLHSRSRDVRRCDPTLASVVFLGRAKRGVHAGAFRRVLRRGLFVGFTVVKGAENGSQKGF